MNLRSWIKKTTAGRIAWRVFIGFIGGGITVAGAVALRFSREGPCFMG